MATQYRNTLITGGAGCVGSNLAVWLKQRYPDMRIIAMDNLERRGSALVAASKCAWSMVAHLHQSGLLTG